MHRADGLAARFESERVHLQGVAYRILGSLDEAADAVQQAWLRMELADLGAIQNLTGWLTTVTGRICLDMLRARRRRDETSLPASASLADSTTRLRAQPEGEAVLADSVGLALLVVMDRLSPAQRVAFVLHDLFAVPFEDIAVVVDRSAAATKKLASRARERVRGVSPCDAPYPAEHDAVVHAFLRASQGGDIDALLELLAPDVVRRADRFAVPANVPSEVRGARAVAEQSRRFVSRARTAEVALVDGAPGIVIAPMGRLFAILRVTISGNRITEFDVIADPAELDKIVLAVPESISW
jgi:RNA polymerase sigma-70 factor (ECF subfamily)